MCTVFLYECPSHRRKAVITIISKTKAYKLLGWTLNSSEILSRIFRLQRTKTRTSTTFQDIRLTMMITSFVKRVATRESERS